MNQQKKEFPPEERDKLLKTLKKRFDKNMNRHTDLHWTEIKSRLINHRDKLWSLNQMEQTGGEPDVVSYNKAEDKFIFIDCSPESPKGRRSVCYDRKALESRKKYKPENNAMDMAKEIGIELLTEEQYQELQTLGPFDTKTSSWLKTPSDIRELGGAIFGDFRYGKVFIYHNGAESYYAARGFRGVLKV